MQYPEKLQETLTQACLDLHEARTIEEVEAVEGMLKDFDPFNYPIPEWLLQWIQITKKNPLLTAEEHYKMDDDDYKFELSELSKKIETKYKKVQLEELRKLTIAIQAADCDTNPTLRNCAYMIAARMLKNPFGSDDFGGDLYFEWHSKTDEFQSLTNPKNFTLFVKILRRETAFWEFGMKTGRKIGPKLQPMTFL